MFLTIDSVTYNIPLKPIRRKAELLFKYAERTEDGILHTQVIGTYFNYDLELGDSVYDLDEYILLWQKLTEPVESHTITIPDEDGVHTFDCYFANINDREVKATNAGARRFKDLSFSVIATSPARTP